MFSIGLFAVFWIIGSLELHTVLTTAPFISETVVSTLGILLLGGAISKSAQLPLHT